jgi:hypothetical protein
MDVIAFAPRTYESWNTHGVQSGLTPKLNVQPRGVRTREPRSGTEGHVPRWLGRFFGLSSD